MLRQAIVIVPGGEPLRWRRYDVPQHVAPETSDALRFCAVEGDLELLDRRHWPTIAAPCGGALDVQGLHRLDLIHATGNLASCRVAAEAGFALEGTMRQHARHEDGWHDMHLHVRLRVTARDDPSRPIQH